MQKLRRSIKSVNRNPIYSLFIFIPLVIISFMFFAGTVVDQSLVRGMANMEKRLGSDLMLVPAGSKEEATSTLLEGYRGTFYFSKDVYEQILNIDGIKEVTAQFYLKSLSADCCSSEVEIVFYDPESDFIIGSWINSKVTAKLDANSIIIGSQVNATNGYIKLFGKEYKVAAQMAKTGTSLDSSVYFTFDSLESVLTDAQNGGAFLTDNQKQTDLISSVFINVNDGVDLEKIIENIEDSVDEDIDIVYPKELSSNLRTNLKGIYTSTHLIFIFTGILIFFILVIVNIIIVNERKREIALLRVFGVSRKNVISILNEGAVLIAIVASATGCVLANIIVVMFSNLLARNLDMPYLLPSASRIILLYIVVIAVLALITALSSLVPAIYISSLEVYKALRKEGE
ncbi:ABC transporter permease [Lachnospira multipara]|uniref:Putative ABC transport system permease protein n=1 Tax=Lachnospira multipara TaxID=28051 RepID=A0A1H5TUL3_9FIRM|nr:ABC transporter permease [Lachnospira multipara]SEF65741.1 putative ABC transport system permease protein [Lachnospira multipara]